MKKFFCILIAMVSMIESKAYADAQVLPPGVRAFVYRRAQAKVPGRFNARGELDSFAVQKTLPIEIVGELASQAQSLIDTIDKSDPELVKQMNLGTIDITPQVEVDGDGFGLAWGLGKNFMVVGVVPVMQARVKLQGGYVPSSSIQETAKRLEEMSKDPSRPDRETLSVLAQLLKELPDVDGPKLQHLLVNYFGYKPVGNWSASGLGDVQLYGQYLYSDRERLKNAAKLGMDFPTGRTNDPDNILDVAFGTGYYTTFVESLNDIYVFGNDRLILNANAKYQYNWPTQATMRLPSNTGLPLTREKEDVFYKAGSIYSYALGAELELAYDIRTYGMLTWMHRDRDHMAGSRADYDYSILSTDTDSSSQTYEVGIFYSTANLYLEGKFPVPFKTKLAFQKTSFGRNTESIDMAFAELQLYF